jgi:hypothetical protein
MSERSESERKILSPFDRRECISLRQAAVRAGKSETTMRGWCERHGLGRRVGGGTWSVSKVALAMWLDNDLKALKVYHAGDRGNPIVSAYFGREGLGDMVRPAQQDGSSMTRRSVVRLSDGGVATDGGGRLGRTSKGGQPLADR